MSALGYLALGIVLAWWWDVKRAHPWFLDHHEHPPTPTANPLRGKRRAYDIDPLMRARLPKE